MIVILTILISLFILVSVIPFIQYIVSKKSDIIIYNFSTDLIDANYPEGNYISQENIITKAKLEKLKEEVYNNPLP